MTKEKLARGKAILETEKRKTAALNEQIQMRDDWAKTLTDINKEHEKQAEAREKLKGGKK